jgi:hypothetical protein
MNNKILLEQLAIKFKTFLTEELGVEKDKINDVPDLIDKVSEL